jgi:hypothetical protein
MVGDHEVTIHVHRDVDVPLKIRVLWEGREEAAESAPASGEAVSDEEEPEDEE